MNRSPRLGRALVTLVLAGLVMVGLVGCGSKPLDVRSLPGPLDRVEKTTMVRSTSGLCYLHDPEWLGTQVTSIQGRWTGLSRRANAFWIDLSYGGDLKRIIAKPQSPVHPSQIRTVESFENGQIAIVKDRHRANQLPDQVIARVFKQLDEGVAMMLIVPNDNQFADPVDDNLRNYLKSWWKSAKWCAPPEPMENPASLTPQDFPFSDQNIDPATFTCPATLVSVRADTSKVTKVGDQGAVRCEGTREGEYYAKFLTAPVLDKMTFQEAVKAMVDNAEFITSNQTFGRKTTRPQDICTIYFLDYMASALCHADDGYRGQVFVKTGNRIRAVVQSRTNNAKTYLIDLHLGRRDTTEQEADYSFLGFTDIAVEDTPETPTKVRPIAEPCPPDKTWCRA